MSYVKKTNNPRMGRPTTNPRNIDLKIRLSEAESEMLNKCAAATGRTRTDIIVEGVTTVYKELQKDGE